MDPTPNFFTLAASASFLLKILIDGIKLAWPKMPTWGVPVAALLLSPAITWAVLVYGGAWAYTPKDYAGLFLGSIVTFGMAVGVTELQRTVQARSAARGQGGTTP